MNDFQSVCYQNQNDLNFNLSPLSNPDNFQSSNTLYQTTNDLQSNNNEQITTKCNSDHVNALHHVSSDDEDIDMLPKQSNQPKTTQICNSEDPKINNSDDGIHEHPVNLYINRKIDYKTMMETRV